MIRQDTPPFGVPSVVGERYGDLVPDTLDLQERAALAVIGLTGPTDPEQDHLLYFDVHFDTRPPQMNHGSADICQTKFMEALPLMRMASGSDLESHIDGVWMETALRSIGPDGLVYWPAFPWAEKPDWCEPSAPGDQFAVPFFVGRMMSAMTVYMLRDPQGPWRREIESVVGALDELAIHTGDYAYFPQGGFVPGGPRPREAELPTGIWSSLAGWTTQGLAQFYQATGYELAGVLAGKLARYIRHHGRYYDPSGELMPDHPGRSPEASHRDGVHPFDPGPNPELYRKKAHFQHHMVPLLGLLDYALAAGDGDMAAFVRQSFEWARGKGEATVGYFPEHIDKTELEFSEICEVAGMIGLAVKLSHAGLGDYWDDVDRWLRNQFAEGQLREVDWVHRMADGARVGAGGGEAASETDLERTSIDRVAERNMGAFAGWPSANDFFTGKGAGIRGCCTGNAARTLYYVWERMLTCEEGELRVNLLLNRPSRWADVKSLIPYEGRVDVHIKEPSRLSMRIPEWTRPDQVVWRVDGESRRPIWVGRYGSVGPVSPGQVVEMSFPIGESERAVVIENGRYALTTRGNEVVQIDPPGKLCPLYQRDAYREGATRWKKVTRFVSAEDVSW